MATLNNLFTAGRLSLSCAAPVAKRKYASVEVLQQTSQAVNSSGITGFLSQPTCESPGTQSVSARSCSNTPALEHSANSVDSCSIERSLSPQKSTSLRDDSCNQDRMQGLEDIGSPTQLQHGNCQAAGEDVLVEKSPANSTPDVQTASNRPDQTEHAKENKGAIDSPHKVQGTPISNTIVGQLYDDKDDSNENCGDDDNDEEDRAHSLCLDNVSTPLAEITAANSNSPDTKTDSQADCSAQLLSPQHPSRDKRRAQAMHRVSSRARGHRGKPNPSKHSLPPQVSSSKSKRDDSDEHYSSLHRTSALQPKRRKTINRGSFRRPAANHSHARYDEWPAHNATLKRVIDADANRVLVQLQFEQDLSHHHQNIRATSPPDRYEGETSAEDTVGSGEELYDVEEILDWKWKDDKQRMEYRIKWDGYDSADNTWEPLENLVQCQAQLAQFHRRRESASPHSPQRQHSKTKCRLHHC